MCFREVYISRCFGVCMYTYLTIRMGKWELCVFDVRA